MRTYRTALLLSLTAITALIATPRTAPAVVNGFNVTVEPWGGFAKWAKNINFESKVTYGGTLGLRFHRYFGIEGFGGVVSPVTNHGKTIWNDAASVVPSVKTDILYYGGNIIVDLRPSAWIDPFVTAGWQEGKVTFKAPPTPDLVTYANGYMLGGGVKLRPAPRFAIRADVKDLIWKFDSPPASTPPGTDATDNLMFTAGLEFAIGGSTHAADSDNDGVSDKKDKCPDTPVGAKVDGNGCPSDADGDGVWDGLDRCANTPRGATVDARGCPHDSDNDRVWDGIDQCPDTPANAVVDERGCPLDRDGDGVPDGIDQCADTPRGKSVDARGCPIQTDADNDGVPDDRDLCPNTQVGVKVDKDGCPIELTEKETELLDKGRITERMIHFETAKWVVLPESYPVLDNLGNILIQWPRLRIEIGGHADARGSEQYNHDLSHKRADAVMTYLLEKFSQLNRDNFTAVGYGESQPVASNKTVEGMAQNRRVEFKVLNPEELKKERERRRILKQGE